MSERMIVVIVLGFIILSMVIFFCDNAGHDQGDGSLR